MLLRIRKCSTRKMAENANITKTIYINPTQNIISQLYNNYTIEKNDTVPYGYIALSAQIRKDLNLNLNTYIDIL